MRGCRTAEGNDGGSSSGLSGSSTCGAGRSGSGRSPWRRSWANACSWRRRIAEIGAEVRRSCLSVFSTGTRVDIEAMARRRAVRAAACRGSGSGREEALVEKRAELEQVRGEVPGGAEGPQGPGQAQGAPGRRLLRAPARRGVQDHRRHEHRGATRRRYRGVERMDSAGAALRE